jgi:hypothetical protein
MNSLEWRNWQTGQTQNPVVSGTVWFDLLRRTPADFKVTKNNEIR